MPETYREFLPNANFITANFITAVFQNFLDIFYLHCLHSSILICSATRKVHFSSWTTDCLRRNPWQAFRIISWAFVSCFKSIDILFLGSSWFSFVFPLNFKLAYFSLNYEIQNLYLWLKWVLSRYLLMHLCMYLP